MIEPATDVRPEAVDDGPSATRSERWATWLPDPRAVLLLIILASVLARVLLLPKPDGALIFDETYYVNAARTILHLLVPAGSPYAGAPAGLDPNTEHPPLGKVLIAASMLAVRRQRVRLADAVRDRRDPCDPAPVRHRPRRRWRSLDGDDRCRPAGVRQPALVHSRIGSLDMLLVVFLLFGAWSALRGWSILAGIGFALAALVKINGVFGLGAALLVELVLLAWARQDGRAPGGRTRRRSPCWSSRSCRPGSAACGCVDAAFTGFASP